MTRKVVTSVCLERLEPLRAAFGEYLQSPDAVGAALAVFIEGECVLDLWGGFADKAKSRPWDRDTVVCMRSVGKGMAALCVLRLVDQGKLELDAPVARHWPEYACNGKEETTVRQFLNHTAGVYDFNLSPPHTLFDWEESVAALARRTPEYRPGLRGGYHSITYGHLLGELVRRVDGRPIQTYFAEEIAGPLDADFYFGLKEADLPRVADTCKPLAFDKIDPTTARGRQYLAIPRGAEVENSREYRMGVFPAGGGHGNARGAATIFGALANGGGLGSHHLMDPETLRLARERQWFERCWITGRDFRVGLGMLLNGGDVFYGGPEPTAFGTAGTGGQFALADPVRRLSLGFCLNNCDAEGIGPTPPMLIDALYHALER